MCPRLQGLVLQEHVDDCSYMEIRGISVEPRWFYIPRWSVAPRKRIRKQERMRPGGGWKTMDVLSSGKIQGKMVKKQHDNLELRVFNRILSLFKNQETSMGFPPITNGMNDLGCNLLRIWDFRWVNSVPWETIPCYESYDVWINHVDLIWWLVGSNNRSLYHWYHWYHDQMMFHCPIGSNSLWSLTMINWFLGSFPHRSCLLCRGIILCPGLDMKAEVLYRWEPLKAKLLRPIPRNS